MPVVVLVVVPVVEVESELVEVSVATGVPALVTRPMPAAYESKLTVSPFLVTCTAFVSLTWMVIESVTV